MLASARIPLIFLACVNSYKAGKRLRYLVRERKAIADIFSSDTHVYYEAVQKGNISNKLFFNLLEKFNYHQRVAIIHLTGHADGENLRIESDQFETTVKLSELSEIVAKLPNLQAVFLSGCATSALVEMLLYRDVPAVLVTETGDEAPLSTNIALAFYRQIAKGNSIREAHQKVAEQFPEFAMRKVAYDIETDTLNWEGKEFMKSFGRMGWGMYCLDDNETKLNHKAQRRLSIPFPLDETLRKAHRVKKRWKYLKYSVAIIVLTLMAFSLTLYLDQPEQFLALLSF